ncbi:hypothetical protein C1646_754489 [Rhizophagus diaphanus]|nr:hypothetical protein C1646_754489 [Rhizophagus diaphanus] [Rhizophagus sp. MUCL 43196]
MDKEIPSKKDPKITAKIESTCNFTEYRYRLLKESQEIFRDGFKCPSFVKIRTSSGEEYIKVEGKFLEDIRQDVLRTKTHIKDIILNYNINDLTSDQEQFNEQLKLNHKLQVENEELKILYKEADSCYKDLKLKYDTLMSIVNKPPNDQNQEISTPPMVETIKSSTNCETSSSDSDFDELEREIFDLSDNSTKSNPFQLKKPHVKNNNKKNSDNDYEGEDDSDDHRQQSKFQNFKQKASLIEKGKQLDDQIQRKSINSSQEISGALSIINKDQISIIDIDTAKYKLYHLKMLHDIYNELVNLGQKLNTNKNTTIEAGCTPTTFHVHNSHYKMFLLQLPDHIRRNISAQSSSLSNITSISTSKAIVKSNKKAHLTGSSTILINDDEKVVNENIAKVKIGDKKQPVAFTALLIDKK